MLLQTGPRRDTISHVQKHPTTASTAQTEPLSLVDTEKVYGRGKDAHYEGDFELATLASRLKEERKAISTTL